MSDEHGAAAAVEIASLEGECFTDSETSAPEKHDERAEAMAVGAIADGSHDGDDLFDRRRVGRVLLALIAGGRPR